MLSVQVRKKMIIYRVLLPILLILRTELAEKVSDPCSEFSNNSGKPTVKCWSEKQIEDYLECYDLSDKEIMANNSGKSGNK